MSPAPEGVFDTREPSLRSSTPSARRPLAFRISDLRHGPPEGFPYQLSTSPAQIESVASAPRSFRYRDSEEPQSLPLRRASTPHSTGPLRSRAPKDSRPLRSFDRTSGVSNPAGPPPHSSEDPRGFRPRTFDPSSPLSGTGSLKSGRTKMTP
jgi:hypothetical protein